MGVVKEIGTGVQLIKPGDRVVVTPNIACGSCLNCIQGLTNECLTLNPKAPGATYGTSKGSYGGGQAEYLRVPYGDLACLKLPGEPGDKLEDDYVLLSDIFPTAYHATELANVKTGKSVAIFGAGPVGLLTAYSSKLKGASEVYIVDKSVVRLKLAESIGAIPINFRDGDPAEQIMGNRKNNKKIVDGLRPGEEKALGIDCVIDAVGFQSLNRENVKEYKRNQVLMDMANIVNAGGNIGIIGVYIPYNPAADDDNEKEGNLIFPMGKLWSKSVQIGTGVVPAKKYQPYLRNLISNRVAKPSFIVSDRITIEDAPQTYHEFDRRDEIVKPVIKF
jgi:glutathione-independent formaldehyde dehydrogenase